MTRLACSLEQLNEHLADMGEVRMSGQDEIIAKLDELNTHFSGIDKMVTLLAKYFEYEVAQMERVNRELDTPPSPYDDKF